MGDTNSRKEGDEMDPLFIDPKATPKHIHGLDCNVKNCSYHDGESYCTAKQIHIGPASAKSGSDTLCATFKRKEM